MKSNIAIASVVVWGTIGCAKLLDMDEGTLYQDAGSGGSTTNDTKTGGTNATGLTALGGASSQGGTKGASASPGGTQAVVGDTTAISGATSTLSGLGGTLPTSGGASTNGGTSSIVAAGGSVGGIPAMGGSAAGGISSGGVVSNGGSGAAAGSAGTTSTSTSSPCPAGSAVSAKSGSCFTCSSTMACNATGETGKLYPLTAVFGTQETCICETSPGYFYSRSQNVTEPCDKDNDGWVRDSAIAVMSDGNQAVKDNMRCTVRMASQVVLHSESGDSTLTLYLTGTAEALQVATTAPDGSTPDAAASDTATAAALPLFESVRNDDDSKLQTPTDPGVPSYGTQHLTDSERNSFTKACVTPTADHNDNSIPDVQEWARLPDQQISGPPITDLRSPYVPLYNRFSYYMELNKGWFEVKSTDANAKTQTGIYHIQERSRAAAAADGLGIIADPSRNSDYWRSCVRKVDSLYSTDTNPTTLDFASVDSTAWVGMLHHSQFKCIQIISEDDQDYAKLDDNGRKNQVYKTKAD